MFAPAAIRCPGRHRREEGGTTLRPRQPSPGSPRGQLVCILRHVYDVCANRRGDRFAGPFVALLHADGQEMPARGQTKPISCHQSPED